MLNILVQLFIPTGGLCSVEIATTYDATVGCVEIESVRNIVKIAKR